MPQDISGLETEVSEAVTVMQGAKTLIDGFKARLEDAKADPAKLAALRADLDTHGSALATAIAANTVAEGEPPAGGGGTGGGVPEGRTRR